MTKEAGEGGSKKMKLKERPIIFSSDMVRATLENRKTQMRMIIKYPEKLNAFHKKGNTYEYCHDCFPCPYGKVGDRLWVRETFWIQRFPDSRIVLYSDDNLIHNKEYMYDYCKKPSTHMPRWASRITLEITDIRVERVQEIEGRDCISEGLEGISEKNLFSYYSKISIDENMKAFEKFENFWNSIYGKDAWERNDWVWVIEFRRIDEVK